MRSIDRNVHQVMAEFGRQLTTEKSIVSAEVFRKLLEMERLRTDRGGEPFSVVTFESNADSEEARKAHTMTTGTAMLNRSRAVDQIGWYTENCIAALLPETRAEGAATFAREIIALLNGSGKYTTYTVLSYPPDQDETSGSALRRNESSFADRRRATESEAGTRHAATLQLLTPFPAWKRALDIFGAVVGLIACVPLFILVAIYIRLVSPGPVIFRQDRVGEGGRTFRCFKFRTMHIRAESDRVHQEYYATLIKSNAPMKKLDDQKDKRILPGAGFLRKIGVDELPQLVNVLKGDMTLVGPRPCIPYEAREYQLWQRERLDIRPGLTGLWQVSGKNDVSFETMVRLDVRYASTVSFAGDVHILLKTFPTLAKLAMGSGHSGEKRRFSVI